MNLTTAFRVSLGHSLARVALTLACVAFAISGCSKDARSLVPVDVSVLQSVDGVTKVVVTVSADGKVVGTQTIDWSANGSALFRGGVYVPSDVKGEVTVTAAGYSASDELIAQSPAQTTTVAPGVQTIVIILVLEPAANLPADGGMGGSAGTGGMPNADAGMGGAGGVGMTGGSGGAVGGMGGTAVMGGMGGTAVMGGMGGTAVMGGMGGTAVMMRMWNPAANVEKDVVSSSRIPMIGMDRKNGNAVIVWLEDIGVKAMRYTGSTGALSAPVIVDAQARAVDLRVGMDDSGRATAVWSMNVDDASIDGLWESHTTDGLAWSKPVRLRAGKIYYSDPGIAFDVARNGHARAAWQESANNINTLWSMYFDGTNWSAPAKVRDGSDPYERRPVVALDAVGGGVLIWTQRSGATLGEESVWACRFSGGVALGAPALLETYEGDWASYPHVNLNSAGKGAAMWIQATSARQEVWTSLYDANGWKPAERVVAATWVADPFVVSDNDANLTLAWSQPLSGVNKSNVMYSRRSAAETAWATAMPLETDNVAPGLTSEQPFPRLTVDPSGRVHAAWRKKGANGEQLVYARDYTAAAGWGPEIKLGGVPLLIADSPQLRTADNGLTLAAFYSYYPTDIGSTESFNVFLAVYK